MDEIEYSRKQEKEQADYEALCRRCGACCGSLDGDPCEHLKKDAAGKYFCPIYDHRIGMHKTISGKQFACVPIRDLRPSLPFKTCVYFTYHYIIFLFLAFALGGCAALKISPPAPPQYSVGTVENPVVDSNTTLTDALKKYAPPEFKEKQRLVDVLYYSFDGKIHKGQVVINAGLVKDIQEVFRAALENKFPIQSVIPISHDRFYKAGKWNEDEQSMFANNTSAFNYRAATGSKKLSKHAYGFAIDINPVQNPYIKGDKVLPPGAVYDPLKPGTLTRDCPVVKTFLKLGWTWGADWKSLKDYQHFEKVLY